MIIEAQESITIPCRFRAVGEPEILFAEGDDPLLIEIETELLEFRTRLTAPDGGWSLSASTTPLAPGATTVRWTADGDDVYYDWTSTECEPFDESLYYSVPVSATNSTGETKTEQVKIKIRPVGDLPFETRSRRDCIQLAQCRSLRLEVRNPSAHAPAVCLRGREVEHFHVRCSPTMTHFPATLHVPENAHVEVETVVDQHRQAWVSDPNTRRWHTQLVVADRNQAIRVLVDGAELVIPLRFSVG